jgi:hypothetical protein
VKITASSSSGSAITAIEPACFEAEQLLLKHPSFFDGGISALASVFRIIPLAFFSINTYLRSLLPGHCVN